MKHHAETSGQWILVLVDPDRWDAPDKGLSFTGPFHDLVTAWQKAEEYLVQLNAGIDKDDTPFQTYVAPLWADEI